MVTLAGPPCVQSYSFDASGTGSAKAVSVYLDPADPSQAMIDKVPDRVVAGLLILGVGGGRFDAAGPRRHSQLPVVPPETEAGPRVQAVSSARTAGTSDGRR